MFDVLDDLEDAVRKLAAHEGFVDVVRLTKLADQLEFERLRAVREFDRSASWAAEFKSAAAALRAKTRVSAGQAGWSVKFARKLEQLPQTAAAFAANEITREHAAVIAAPATPARIEMLQRIEPWLVDIAKRETPGRLRAIVEHYVELFDGNGGADKDKHNHDLNKVTLSSTYGRRGVLNGSLDPEITEIALTALDAEMEVLRQRGETRTTPQLRADAFASICRQYLASRGDTGAHGRGQTHLSVMVDIAKYEKQFPDLVSEIRAEFAHGQGLSRSTLERISCDCKISRVIMDGPSCVLDVGWTQRTVTNAQWNALVARDKHCTEPDCTVEPSRCEAHHVWYWEHGGPTNLSNLKLKCWYHHRKIHAHDAQAGAG